MVVYWQLIHCHSEIRISVTIRGYIRERKPLSVDLGDVSDVKICVHFDDNVTAIKKELIELKAAGRYKTDLACTIEEIRGTFRLRLIKSPCLLLNNKQPPEVAPLNPSLIQRLHHLLEGNAET